MQPTCVQNYLAPALDIIKDRNLLLCPEKRSDDEPIGAPPALVPPTPPCML
jgi:hypothetical protein